MDESPHKSGGLLNSLHRIGDSLLGLAQSRIELFAVELREEKLRDLNLLAWLVVALALVVAGLLIGLGALAVYLWDIAGHFGVAGLALATVASGAGMLWGIRRRIQHGPIPFAETIDGFRKDRECLRQDL